MVSHATSTLTGVDVLTLVVEGGKLIEEDEHILRLLKNALPCFAVLSKVDLIQDKTELLPQIQQLHDTGLFQQKFYPLSALKGDGLEDFRQQIFAVLPSAPHLFADDEVTDKPGEIFGCRDCARKINASVRR